MSKSNSKKIFISYGHVDATDLAVRLKSDLEAKGHDVWLDISRMRDAESWEDQIEVEILNREIFIALLSPHAVHRPDGVCRDEISMARYEHRKIIPVMVLKCRPPLAVYRLNWIDFQNWEHENQYQKAFERLLKAIDAEVAVEGIYASIFSEIKQIDFGSEIFDLIRDFTGREWLFRELDSWLEKEESRVFLITGDPGIGKSAIMAYLVHNHPGVVACHFCDSEIKDSLDANLFIKSIAAQLATQLDNYRGALEGVDLEELIEFGDPGTLMRRLIIDPLKAEHHDKPIIIVIDALDEILTDPSSNIVKILRNQLKHLPTWIRLVLSSRKEPKIVDSFSKFKPHEIEASRPENLQDIKIYLNQQLEMAEISEKLTKKGVSKEFVADVIYNKSEGNFLCVKEAIEAIKEGSIDPSHPESYPDALIGFYMSYFERKFPNGQGYEEIRKILDIILAARELLTAEQIAFFIKLDSFEVEKKLQKLAVYFPKRVNHYKVYHKALIDWLLGDIGSDTTYRVNIERGHRIISDKLFQSYQDEEIPSFLSKYLLRHLPQHLLAIKEWGKITKILSDLQFIELCANRGLIGNLINNYTDAISSKELPSIQEFKQFVFNQAHILLKNPHLTVQQALNQPDSTTPSQVGKNVLKIMSYSNPWLEWINKPQELDPSLLPSNWHSSSVLGCDFSPDGTKMVSVSDYDLKLWNIETGTEIKSINYWNSYSYPIINVKDCVYSSDGVKIVSAGGEILIFEPLEVKTETEIITINKFKSAVDVKKGHKIMTINGFKSTIEACAFSRDGSKIIFEWDDKRLKIWDIETGTEILTSGGHSSRVLGYAFSPDGTQVVSASFDGSLKLWDVETGAEIRTYTGHSSSVNSCAFSPDGTKIISASNDYTLKLWEVETGAQIKTFTGHSDGVWGCTFSPDGMKAISASWDMSLKLWDVETGTQIRTFTGHSDGVWGCAFSPDGTKIISASNDYTLKLWDVEKGDEIRTYTGHSSGVNSCAFSPDGTKIISASNDKTLKLWNVETGTQIKTFTGHSHWVMDCAFSPDGSKVVSASMDKTLKIWNMPEITNFKELKLSLDTCAFSPDGLRIIAASTDGKLKLWDIKNHTELKIFKGQPDRVLGYAFSPDGTRVVSASFDGTLKLWDVETGDEIRTYTGHSSSVNSCAFSPDGTKIISASNDKTLKLWDVETETEIITFTGHDDSVMGCAFSQNGTIVVSVSWDYTVKVWETNTGIELMTFPTLGAVNCVAVGVNDLIAAGDLNGGVYILHPHGIKFKTV